MDEIVRPPLWRLRTSIERNRGIIEDCMRKCSVPSGESMFDAWLRLIDAAEREAKPPSPATPAECG